MARIPNNTINLEDGRITLLVGADEVTIEVHDRTAGIEFLEIKLTPEQFCQALSRLSMTHCASVKLRGLSLIGKRQEYQTFVFEMPEESRSFYGAERKALAVTTVQSVCPEDWVPDTYFGSQDSFFERDGKSWGRTMIRRWVEIEQKGR